jgi:hypothetical protein
MWAIVLTAVITAITWTTTAHADWQYTRWGMTPEQTLAASKGQLKRCEGGDCSGQTTDQDVAQLFGNYQSGELSFTAFMIFDKRTNTLSRVYLNLNAPEKGDSLIRALRLKYGEPSRHDREREGSCLSGMIKQINFL